jgi:hypothetical protein
MKRFGTSSYAWPVWALFQVWLIPSTRPVIWMRITILQAECSWQPAQVSLNPSCGITG